MCTRGFCLYHLACSYAYIEYICSFYSAIHVHRQQQQQQQLIRDINNNNKNNMNVCLHERHESARLCEKTGPQGCICGFLPKNNWEKNEFYIALVVAYTHVQSVKCTRITHRSKSWLLFCKQAREKKAQLLVNTLAWHDMVKAQQWKKKKKNKRSF